MLIIVLLIILFYIPSHDHDENNHNKSIHILIFAPKTGALWHEPKMGAMSSPKLSIHSPQQIWLRQFLIQRRLQLGLSQRTLATKLGVIYSFVGKVETGDRRLDLFEFMSYCSALELDSLEVLKHIQENFYTDTE